MSKATEAIKAEKANKNKKVRRIGATVALLAIVGVVAYIVVAKPNVERQDNSVSFVQSSTNQSNTNDLMEGEEQNIMIELGEEKNEVDITTNETTQTKKTKVTTLSDGTLYSVSDNFGKADIVIGNNFFDTQLSDILTNFSRYEGKKIEIEGFYLENTPYTFVGRYSESNLCSYCPQGYSYFEYEWKGDQKFNFTNEKEWLKIKGTLRQGLDDGIDYYYIDVASLEVMNERGQDTVKN